MSRSNRRAAHIETCLYSPSSGYIAEVPPAAVLALLKSSPTSKDGRGRHDRWKWTFRGPRMDFQGLPGHEARASPALYSFTTEGASHTWTYRPSPKGRAQTTGPTSTTTSRQKAGRVSLADVHRPNAMMKRPKAERGAIQNLKLILGGDQ